MDSIPRSLPKLPERNDSLPVSQTDRQGKKEEMKEGKRTEELKQTNTRIRPTSAEAGKKGERRTTHGSQLHGLFLTFSIRCGKGGQVDTFVDHKLRRTKVRSE
mmetsp:Transcript_2008/g.4225  ORF Transcript_2008/g.4225 Transcript_2008/m.4225 type:complete len:103 (-) Transcript_2008:1355-1663(-)